MGKSKKNITGRIDKVDLLQFDPQNINAKIDTRACKSSLHRKGKLTKEQLSFQLMTDFGYRRSGGEPGKNECVQTGDLTGSKQFPRPEGIKE